MTWKASVMHKVFSRIISSQALRFALQRHPILLVGRVIVGAELGVSRKNNFFEMLDFSSKYYRIYSELTMLLDPMFNYRGPPHYTFFFSVNKLQNIT
jgi:hypothetical protein